MKFIINTITFILFGVINLFKLALALTIGAVCGIVLMATLITNNKSLNK